MSNTTLKQFLIATPLDDMTKEVTLPGRLSKFKFKIKPITGPEFAEYQKRTSRVGKKGKIELDNKLFNELLILNHTVEPNFRDIEAIKAAGCKSPEQFLYSRLLAGEISQLAQEISVLSGFDRDMDDLVEDAKN